MNKDKVYFWNIHGGEIVFSNVDAALRRAIYRGQSGTEGVSMYDIDGIRYFTKDMPI